MTVGELTGIQPGQDEREDVRGAGEPAAAAGGNSASE